MVYGWTLGHLVFACVMQKSLKYYCLVDCLEIAVLRSQGYNQTEVAEKFGVHKSKISRHWTKKCMKCIEQIIAENNME